MDNGWTVDLTRAANFDASPSVWFKVRNGGPFRYVWAWNPVTDVVSFELSVNLGFTRIAVGW